MMNDRNETPQSVGESHPLPGVLLGPASPSRFTHKAIHSFDTLPLLLLVAAEHCEAALGIQRPNQSFLFR